MLLESPFVFTQQGFNPAFLLFQCDWSTLENQLLNHSSSGLLQLCHPSQLQLPEQASCVNQESPPAPPREPSACAPAHHLIQPAKSFLWLINLSFKSLPVWLHFWVHLSQNHLANMARLQQPKLHPLCSQRSRDPHRRTQKHAPKHLDLLRRTLQCFSTKYLTWPTH